MERTEIQERNEQIALMLGVQLHDSQLSIPHSHYTCYHSDWNWLMEAVEFISKNGFTYSIYKNDKLYCCSIRIDRTISDFILIKNESQKEAVFKAVSDFAKKFNNKEL
jgi:hypothetical protein